MESGTFPERPITIVVAFPPGGVDEIARLVEPELAKSLGVEVRVVNRPGAGGTLGTAEAASAVPDGYTLLLSPQGPLAYQPRLRDVPYGAASFAPICRLTETPSALMASMRSGFRTIAEVIAGARSSSRQVTFSSAGEGGLPHVGMAAFGRLAGIEMEHLPGAGAADALDALIAGKADLLAEQVPLAASGLSRGGVRVIGVFAPQRSPAFPDAPTLREEGYDIALFSWNVLLAPAGTPEHIVARLSEACAAALATPAVADAMTNTLRAPPAYLDPPATAAFVQAEVERGRKLTTASGLAR